jgi:hypothetical protein
MPNSCDEMQRLGCGWFRSGAIGAIRIGKDNKFDPATVSQFLEARQL